MMLVLGSGITTLLEHHRATFTDEYHTIRLYNLQMHVLAETITLFWGDDTDNMLEYMQTFLNNHNERHKVVEEH